MKQQQGIIVVLTLMIMAALFSIALGFSVLILSDLRKARTVDSAMLAYYAADSGIEHSLYLLRKESNNETIDDVATLKAISGGEILDVSNAGWDISGSVDAEAVVFRQRLENGQNVKLYFLGRSAPRTNNSASLTVDWSKGGGSPKLQVIFTQLNLQTKDIGGESVVINYTDIDDVNLLDTPTQGFPECYEFTDRDINGNAFLSDYLVEVRVVGRGDDVVDNLTIKSYDTDCSSITPSMVANGSAITNLTIRSVGAYRGVSQEVVAHLPPKELSSSVLGFVLFSAEDITKDYAVSEYIPPEPPVEPPVLVDCFNPADDPIKICTCDDLDNVRNYLDRNFVLQNNIDFNVCDARYTTGEGWEPIGGKKKSGESRVRFTGDFNGNNHRIANLFINKSGTSFIGLFGFAEAANISNLILDNIRISLTDSDYGFVGGLVGSVDVSTSVSNIRINGSILAEGTGNAHFIGGLVGAAQNNSSIVGSDTAVNISGDGWGCGGLAGYADGSIIISDSYALNDVSGYWYVGGLVGLSGATISNSYALGNVAVDGQYGGGLVGSGQGGSVSDSYATGNISNTSGGTSYFGGLMGEATFSSITNSFATGDITGSNTRFGGLVGIVNNSSISDSYAVGRVYGGSYVGGLIGEVNKSSISNSYATGGVSGSYQYIGGLVGMVSDNSSISNSYAVGNVNEGLNNSDFHYIGGLVGSIANSSIANSYVSNNIVGGGGLAYTGGLVGYALLSDIINSYAVGNVVGSGLTGGFIGGTDAGTITNSYVANRVNYGANFINRNHNSLTDIADSYWDANLNPGLRECNIGTCDGAEGRTTAEMIQEATFQPAWDFLGDAEPNNIWQINEVTSYPCFVWQGGANNCPIP